MIELKSSQFKGTVSEYLNKIKGLKILVVGDVGLDQYLTGKVTRISPEAPIPVLLAEEQNYRLGLSANVAQNVASLGGQPFLLTVVGEDSAADDLRALCRENGVDQLSWLVDNQRPTTRKERIMAGHQHIVRVDFENRRFLGPEVEEKFLSNFNDLLCECDGVVLQDYAKGVVTEKVAAEVILKTRQAGKKVLVDPHKMTPAEYYRGASLFKPNFDEAQSIAGLVFDEFRAPPGFVDALGQAVLQKIEAENVVMTRGGEGMNIFNVQAESRWVQTDKRPVFDVTGAGDTAMAALSLGWIAGMKLEEACALANYASGHVVGEVGCVTCTPEQVLAIMDQ